MLLTCLAIVAVTVATAHAETPDESAPPPDPFDAGEDEALPTPAPRGNVHIVYTGAFKGIGSNRYPLHILRRLDDALSDLESSVSELAIHHGAMGQGAWGLHAADGKVVSLERALARGRLTCDAPVDVTAVVTELERISFTTDARPKAVESMIDGGARLAPTQRRTCVGDSGVEVVLVGPPDRALPSWDLEDWELQLGLDGVLAEPDGSRLPFTVLARPIQEASRMHAATKAAIAEHPDGLYVDAGDFLAGASAVRDGRLSLHRPLTWGMLEELAPTALVPATNELIAGFEAFRDELGERPLPYLASNLAWSEAKEGTPGADPCQSPQHPLPRCRRVEVETAVGPVQIAFVGILDPAILEEVPVLVTEGLTIGAPVSATQDLVDALFASDRPPDVVMALTTAGGPVLADLRRSLRGVDLMAGDPTFATLRVAEREVDLRPLPGDRKGSPVTLPMDGLAKLTLTVDEEGTLTTVRSSPVLVRASGDRDIRVARRVARTRRKVYPLFDHPLVPAWDPEDPLEPWPAAAWSQLICEAVRATTGADTVLLGKLPAPDDVPGPMTELLVLDHLTMLDQLVEFRVPGDKLGTVLDRAEAAVPVACGATAASKKAGGRSLEADRTYRLLTTDRTLHATSLGSLLDGVPASASLDPAGQRSLQAPVGDAAWTLRAAALRGLQEARGRHWDTEAVRTALVEEAPSAKPPLWLLRLRAAKLQLSSFQGVDNDAFSEVPETLATSPSSLTVASLGDVALERTGEDLTWDLRLRGEYSTLATDEETTEVADDWRASTSLAVPLARFPREGVLVWSPYSEMLYDSELTAVEQEDGSQGSPQADLSLTAGLSATPTGPLTALRVGAFANRDLARIDDKPTEFGGRLEMATSTKLSPWLTWGTTLETWVWADTADDDASDLRLKALGRTSFGLPLARWLNVDLYAQGFAVQGRTAVNDELGFAWTLGAALDSKGIWKL